MTASGADEPIPLCSSDLDRAAHRRKDASFIQAALSGETALITLIRDGEPLLAEGPHAGGGLLWLGAQAAALFPSAPSLFLGETPKGSPVFAIDVPSGFSLGASPLAGLGAFRDFRSSIPGLSAREANAAATARAVFDWRARSRHCGRCGSLNEHLDAGWRALCPECGQESYPRVDPVAIMLAVRNDHCLLGRQAGWRPGLWSCLAGFVEPGETVEQAAVRELFEEAGVRARPETGRYQFCQPWPFASSLMIGLLIDADSEEIRIDPSELEEARWFSRSEARMMLETPTPGASAPPPLAIAHHVIRSWLENR